MLKRSLRCCLFVSLVIAIGVVASNAQSLVTMELYKAQIPYDFAVGNKNFQAGEYKVRLKRAIQGDNAVFVTLETAKGEILNTAVGMKNWKTSTDDQAYLVFRRFGENADMYALERIATPGFGYSVRTRRTVTSVKVSKNLADENETVSILMTRIK